MAATHVSPSARSCATVLSCTDPLGNDWAPFVLGNKKHEAFASSHLVPADAVPRNICRWTVEAAGLAVGGLLSGGRCPAASSKAMTIASIPWPRQRRQKSLRSEACATTADPLVFYGLVGVPDFSMAVDKSAFCGPNNSSGPADVPLPYLRQTATPRRRPCHLV